MGVCVPFDFQSYKVALIEVSPELPLRNKLQLIEGLLSPCTFFGYTVKHNMGLFQNIVVER